MIMDNLRAAANHITLKIILILIGISFIMAGANNFIKNDNSYFVAKVNGQKISHMQLEQALQNINSYQQESISEQFLQLNNEDYIDQIRHQMLLRLIDITLLEQYANKLGLVIDDDQIKQAIFAIPSFHTGNRFDNTKFRTLIESMGLSPDQYAALIRKQFLTQQVIYGIINTDFLLPIEIDKLSAIAAQIRDARLATFDITALAEKQIASKNEIQASYNAHKNLYLSPEIFKVKYIPIDIEAIQTKINVDEQEIQLWYNQHNDQFIVPSRKRYSLIQSKNEKEANNLLKQLRQGADFSTLAKNHSIDTASSKNCGDIGWVIDNDSSDELRQANLKEKGQISGIIKSSIGFFIVRLDDIELAQISPLSIVHDEISKKIKKEKAIAAYYTLQQKVSDAIINNNDTLALVEEITGIKAQDTEWFNQNNVPTALDYLAVKQALFKRFSLRDNELLGKNLDLIVVNENRALAIRIMDHHSEYVKSLEEVYVQVELAVKRQKAIENASIDAEKIITVLKNSNNDKSAEVLKAAGLNFSTVQHFDYSQQGNLLAKTIFSLPQPLHGKSSYGMSTNDHGDIVLISLDKITSRSIDDKQRKTLADQLNKELASIAFDALIKNLRSVAKIEIGTAI